VKVKGTAPSFCDRLAYAKDLVEKKYQAEIAESQA